MKNHKNQCEPMKTNKTGEPSPVLKKLFGSFFFLLPFFFKSSKNEAWTNTTKWRKKRSKKGRNTKIVIGNTRRNVGSWIFMEKIENNIKDKKLMRCIARKRREN
jgi:hypothetical protein